MAPQLANREQIFQFPNPFRVVLYGPDTSMEAARACLPAANDLQYVLLQRSLADDLAVDWARVSVDFDAVAQNEFWVLYHRVRHTVQCRTVDGNRYPLLVDVVG